MASLICMSWPLVVRVWLVGLVFADVSNFLSFLTLHKFNNFFAFLGPGTSRPIGPVKTEARGPSHQVTLVVDPGMMDMAWSILATLDKINVDQVSTFIVGIRYSEEFTGSNPFSQRGKN